MRWVSRVGFLGIDMGSVKTLSRSVWHMEGVSRKPCDSYTNAWIAARGQLPSI